MMNDMYGKLVSSGMGEIEATEKVNLELNIGMVKLTQEDMVTYLDQAKEIVYYQQKTSEYFDKLKEPKKFSKPTPWQYKYHVVKEAQSILSKAKKVEIVDGKRKLVKKRVLLRGVTGVGHKDLLNYFSGIPGKLDLDKGILIVGNVGRGKTSTMEIFRKNLIGPFKIIPVNDIPERWKEDKYILRKLGNLIKNPFPTFEFGAEWFGLLLDDIGAKEDENVNDFGTKTNVVEYIVSSYYHNKIWNRLHGTTNLSPRELLERYGIRCYDRMYLMFNIVQFEGDVSFRSDKNYAA